MTQHQLPTRPPTVETLRPCANRQCRNLIAKGSKYPTCSWVCFQAVKTEQEAVEAEDKLPQVRPF